MSPRKKRRRWMRLQRRRTEQLLKAGQYATRSIEFLNVVPSYQTRVNMGNAAFAAFAQMRRDGERNFRVQVESQGFAVNSPEGAEKIYGREHAKWMALANHLQIESKSAESLSDEEKFALCVAARVPVRIATMDKATLVIRLETVYPCAVTMENGKYCVYQLHRDSQLLGES